MVECPKNFRDSQMDFLVLQGLVALLGFTVAAAYVYYRHMKRR